MILREDSLDSLGVLLQDNVATGYGKWRAVSPENRCTNKTALLPTPARLDNVRYGGGYVGGLDRFHDQNVGRSVEHGREFDYDQYERGVGRDFDQGFYEEYDEGYSYRGREERDFGRNVSHQFGRGYEIGYAQGVGEQRVLGRDSGVGRGFSRGFGGSVVHSGWEEPGFDRDIGISQGFNKSNVNNFGIGGQEDRGFYKDVGQHFNQVYDGGYNGRERFRNQYRGDFHHLGVVDDLAEQFRDQSLCENYHPGNFDNPGGAFSYGGRGFHRQDGLLGNYNEQNYEIDVRKMNRGVSGFEDPRSGLGSKSIQRGQAYHRGTNHGRLLTGGSRQSVNQSLSRTIEDYYGKAFDKLRQQVQSNRGKVSN